MKLGILADIHEDLEHLGGPWKSSGIGGPTA